MPVTKWYLNLPRQFGRKTKPHSGPVINLTASAGGALAFAFNATVDWTVDYGGPDGHEDYLPAGPVFAPNQSQRHYNKFKTALTLPMLTGRTYTVEAQRTGHVGQVPLSAQYQTWQRVYLTVHTMNQRCTNIYNAVLPRIQAAFAAAHIEIKPRVRATCLRDEPFTASDDPKLPHLYRSNAHPLDRDPCHVRAVLVNDVARISTARTQFELDNTTVADPEHFIRVSSRGDNHQVIVYENDTVVFNDDEPFSPGTSITATTEPIAVPADCVAAPAESPLVMRDVDVDGDDSLALLELASRARDGRTYKVEVTGTCRARRCAAGWGQQYEHSVTATLTLANNDGNPVISYHNRVWIGDGGRTLFVDHPRLLLDDPAVQSITITVGEQPLVIDPGQAVRVSSSQISVPLPGEAVEALAANDNTGSIAVSVIRLGALANDANIEDEADHAFEIRGLTHVERKQSDDVEIWFAWPDYNLRIRGKTLLFARGSTPTINVQIKASVRIPDAAWTLHDEGRKLEIDLSAHDDLEVAAAAMAAGRTVSFDGFFEWRQSLGGYNIANENHFIAITTKRLRDWDDAEIEHRVLLTFCHEIGHAVGLTPTNFHNHQNGGNVPHPNYYTDDQGGRGPHCHHNAQLVPAGSAHGRPDTASGQIWWPRDDGSQLCIMYHALKHERIGDQYCADCLTHLRRCTAHFT